MSKMWQKKDRFFDQKRRKFWSLFRRFFENFRKMLQKKLVSRRNRKMFKKHEKQQKMSKKGQKWLILPTFAFSENFPVLICLLAYLFTTWEGPCGLRKLHKNLKIVIFRKTAKNDAFFEGLFLTPFFMLLLSQKKGLFFCLFCQKFW